MKYLYIYTILQLFHSYLIKTTSVDIVFLLIITLNEVIFFTAAGNTKQPLGPNYLYCAAFTSNNKITVAMQLRNYVQSCIVS